MSKVSTPATSTPNTKPSTPAPAPATTSNPWSRGPPATNNTDSQSGTSTLSSIQAQPQVGFKVPAQPNGNGTSGAASNGVNGANVTGGHSRKNSIMAIGGGMDIKPRGSLAFGTVDSPNPMLSSSPAAPSITGTHLADTVKSFGSVEADSSTAGANMVKPPRRTSALTSNGPSPSDTPATPAKKLDLHALFGNKPQATPTSNVPSTTSSAMSGGPSADRRQSMSQSGSFQGASGLPNSNPHPYQAQMASQMGQQGHLRAPQSGGAMLGSSPRSPILGNNLPPNQFSSPQVQQGFRPQGMMQPNTPGQVRPNGAGGPGMQGVQRPGMMMGQGGMAQYGMHPGQQGGPGYPMGYGGQPGYYGYNMYEQQQYGMPPQWNPQQNQGQGFNMPLSPRAGGQIAQHPGTTGQPSPLPPNAALPGSSGPSPLPTPPTRPNTLANGPVPSSGSIPSIPATPSRGPPSFTMPSAQTPAQLAALSAGAPTFTPRKPTIIKFSRPDGTATTLAEVAASVVKAPATPASGVSTPEVAPATETAKVEVTPAPKKMMPSLPVVVRMETEEARKARIEEEERKERIRKEEEKEERERQERKARVAAEAEEKAKKDAELAEKAKADSEAAEAEKKKADDAAAQASKVAAEKEKTEKETAAVEDEEKKSVVEETKRALLTPVPSRPPSPLSSPALTAAGLPPKPVLAINGAARRAVPAALDLIAPEASSPSLTDEPPSASMSALGTARPIEDISSIVYPGTIQAPSPELNASAETGKFRYNRDFLMQFMDVCREKPENLPPLEAIGLEADPSSGFGARGGARGSRSSMGPPPGRGGAAGLGIGGLNRQAFPQGMGSFGMGNFGGSGSITSRGATSEERYNRSLQGSGRGMNRTPSQSGPSQISGMHGLPPMGQSSSRSGANRSSRGTKRMPQDPRGSFQAEADVAPLVITNNAWVNARSGTTDEKSPAYIERKVKALLNKLTAEKFDSISNQILEWANKSRQETDGMTLKLVIKLVFEKATDEAHWSAMYAKLCRMLLDLLDPAVTEVIDGKEVSGGSLFRKYLLGRCQMDFESGWKAREEAANAAAAKSAEDKERLARQEEVKDKEEEEAGEPILLSDEYYAAQKAKRRGLGLVQLIGELFKLEMLSKGVIRTCLVKLLGNMTDPDEEDLESTCKLLTTVGRSFEAQAKDSMDLIFDRLTTILENENIASRIRFMLLDVIDLRKNRWRARNQQAGVMTIAEIHQQAAQEKAQSAAAAAQSQRESISRGGSRSGHSRGGPQPGEWQSVATGPRPPQRSDFSNVGGGRLSSVATGTLSFGPSSIFSGKGKKGLAGTVTPPISRQASTTNINKFGLLDEAAAVTPEAPAPQRKRLNLKPRSKPLPGEEGEGEGEGEGEEGADEEGADEDEEEEEEEAAPETPTIPAGMSIDAAKTKVASDVKELWGEKDAGGSRNPEDIVEYFKALPAEHQILLATQLVDDVFRIAKVKDAEIVAKGWQAALEAEATTLETLKAGLLTRMPTLEDDSIDFPLAYRATATLFRGISLSTEEIDDLMSKIDLYGSEPKITPKMKLDREFTKLDEEANKA